MTQKKKLTELVDEAMTSVTAFYQRAIELHNDRNLRSLASQYQIDPNDIEQWYDGRIYIVKQRGEDELFYDPDGFNARVAVQCLEEGNWAESGSYEYAERIFRVREGKLVVNAGQYGRQEMLELFPKLTIEKMEEKLAEAIGNSRWLKGEGK